MVTNFATDHHPGTNTKRSKIAFAATSIVLSLGHLGARLFFLPAQSPVETSGTLMVRYINVAFISPETF